jgi:hypothetical protein
LYLNGYLTTIPTSAHTSVFILFLKLKPPLGLAFRFVFVSKRGAHSTCDTDSCKRFRVFFKKNIEAKYPSAQQPKNALYRKRTGWKKWLKGCELSHLKTPTKRSVSLDRQP